MAEIALRDVRKSYGKTAIVHGIDLEVASGEFVVILGPSGCGKSTLLRMIAGLESITSGEIAIAGRVVNRLEPRERGCAMVFQNYALYPHMSVADNIGYALKVAGVGKADRRTRVEAVAKTIGLEHLLDRRPAQLSGGQRQRVAMGRAIVREPQVFLFDEPLSNLDATLRVQMRIEIRKLHNRLNATSVLVTHDQTEAMTLADRIVVMKGGRIEQVDTPEVLYRRPATRFVAGFVGSPVMNLLDGEIIDPDHVGIGGQVLAVPPHGLAKGRRVTVGIRPEDLIPVAPGPGTIAVDVDFIEDLGSLRLLHGRWGTADFVVQVAANQPKGLGPMAFQVSAQTIHLFDAETDRRVPGPIDVAALAA